ALPIVSTESSASSPGPAWQEAAADFVAARVELLSLEARKAAAAAALKGALAAFAVSCAMIAWLLLVAGLVGWIAAAAGWPWHFVALAAAVFHLALAGIAAVLLRRPGPPSFPLSRAELAKDHEWLRNLQDKPKH